MLSPSTSSSSFFASSLFPSAFASLSSLDKRTTITGDQDSNSRSTSNNELVPNNNNNNNNNNNSNTNNNTTTLRTYTNTALDLTVQYPPTWGIMELKTNPYSNSSEVQRSSQVAVIISPLEDQSDKFQERMLIAMQNLLPNRVTLQDYTKNNLESYRNQSDTIKILESDPTTLGGQPAHRIVYTDDNMKGNKLKNIQVWTVINNSRAYVVTFGAEESKYNDYSSDVQDILSSFRITSDGSDNSSSQVERNLIFDDSMFGIKLEYPSSWAKTQPGLPLDNRTFAFIVSFTAPPAISISENGNENNSSSSNSSAVTINVGINDLARFISGGKAAAASPSSSNGNNTANNTKNRDLTLAEYTARQMENIKQVGAKLRSSIKTTVGGLPGQEVHYLVDKGLLVTQAWTLNEGKAYHIVLSANGPDDFTANLPVFREMVKSIKFDFNK